MSENKVYNVFQNNLGEYSVLKGEEKILICTEIEHKEIAELFCDELNDLDEENYELKKENQAIQRKVFKLMDFLETEKGLSRDEIKEWWND